MVVDVAVARSQASFLGRERLRDEPKANLHIRLVLQFATSNRIQNPSSIREIFDGGSPESRGQQRVGITVQRVGIRNLSHLKV